MSLRTALSIGLGLIVLCILAGIAVYPQLPERVASHWNAAGQVDGYMPRFWGVAIFPLTLVAVFVILSLIPVIDPMKANIARFERYYAGFTVTIMAYLAYAYGLTLARNLGVRFDLMPALVPAIAVLTFAAGVMMEHAEQNWFIGIRTPWTLSSQTVWKKTHLLGGRLFKIAGVATLAGILLPSTWAWVWILGVLAAASSYPIVYSYVEYRKEIR